MKKSELQLIIREEIANALTNTNSKIVNESSNDLEQVKYSASVRTQLDKLVDAIKKTPNLSKNAVASILNDIILALGLSRSQMTTYMNMIRQDRSEYKF